MIDVKQAFLNLDGPFALPEKSDFANMNRRNFATWVT